MPAGVPRGAFGPRLHAVAALLGRAYRLCKRPVRAAQADPLGLSALTGMVYKAERQAAEAVAAPTDEV